MNILTRIFTNIFLSQNYANNHFRQKYNTEANISNGFSVDRANLSKDFVKAYGQVRA
ncbi:hypothetical protein [Francisella philomiragia]|uniref:hypothetical protein n=1 Tax=Francisella philomiragia TaxID=28110 RepID=UPI00351956DC